jgi:hypothetical protein
MSTPVTEERLWTREGLKALKRRELQNLAVVCLLYLFIKFPHASRGLPLYITSPTPVDAFSFCPQDLKVKGNQKTDKMIDRILELYVCNCTSCWLAAHLTHPSANSADLLMLLHLCKD